MPKIQFANLPRGIWQHLLDRVEERQISLDDLQLLRDWVGSEPVGPEGDWYKDFGTFYLCGTGRFPKTILLKGMRPYGARID